MLDMFLDYHPDTRILRSPSLETLQNGPRNKVYHPRYTESLYAILPTQDHYASTIKSEAINRALVYIFPDQWLNEYRSYNIISSKV